MSIFGTILSKIFGQHGGGAQGQAQAQPASGGAAQSPSGQGASGLATPAQSAVQPVPMQSAGQQGAAAPAQPVDVEAMLNQMMSQKGQTLNWRTSIVDLLKLLDLDSSLQARKQLAQELHYSGDTSDSASMNLWLHKEVMRQLAANGGKVPEELRH